MKRKAVSNVVAGILVIVLALLAIVAIDIYFFSGLFTVSEQNQLTQFLTYKEQENLQITVSGSSLIVTNVWTHPSRLTYLLKVSTSGSVSLLPINETIFPDQSYTLSNVLQPDYSYAVLTSYGNEFWASYGISNPALAKYSVTITENAPLGTTDPPVGTYIYPFGTKLIISATPDSGYYFVEWIGNGYQSYSGTNETGAVYVWSDIKEEAVFGVEITFNASGVPSGSVLIVNGTTYSANQLPITLRVPYGDTLTFDWLSPVSISNGERAVWVSTSGLSNAQNGTIVATQSGTVSAKYQLQYYLTMKASPPNAGTVSPGSGWYNAGEQISISATGISNSTARSVFVKWVGSGSGSYSGSNDPATITMNSPINETAEFQAQYLLTLNVDPSGSGTATANPGTSTTSTASVWENAGSEIDLSATPRSGYEFSKWVGSGSGSYSGTSSSATITMNGPINETAEFYAGITFEESGIPTSVSNTILTVSFGGSSYQFSASNLPYTFYVPPGTSVSYSWAGTVSTGNTQYELVSVSGPSSPVTVNSPVTILADYNTYYLLTMQVSPSGAGTTDPSAGTHWELAGSTVNISATSNVGYEFVSWSGSGSGSYSGNNNPAKITMNGPITETANFKQVYVSITFSTTGLNSSAQGTVLIVNGTSYTYSNLPKTFVVPYDSKLDFSFQSPISGGSNYYWVWVSTSGLANAQSGTIVATQNGSVVGNYKITYKYVFEENGLPNGATWSVDINGTSYSAPAGSTITVYLPRSSVSWSAPSVTYNGAIYEPNPASGTATPGTTIITYEIPVIGKDIPAFFELVLKVLLFWLTFFQP